MKCILVFFLIFFEKSFVFFCVFGLCFFFLGGAGVCWVFRGRRVRFIDVFFFLVSGVFVFFFEILWS